MRPAVDHPVKRPIDVPRAARRHRDPGVSQVAKCLLVVLALDQLPCSRQFDPRHLHGRQPRGEKIELPPHRDQLGRLLPGKRCDDHVPVGDP